MLVHNGLLQLAGAPGTAKPAKCKSKGKDIGSWRLPGTEQLVNERNSRLESSILRRRVAPTSLSGYSSGLTSKEVEVAGLISQEALSNEKAASDMRRIPEYDSNPSEEDA